MSAALAILLQRGVAPEVDDSITELDLLLLDKHDGVLPVGAQSNLKYRPRLTMRNVEPRGTVAEEIRLNRYEDGGGRGRDTSQPTRQKRALPKPTPKQKPPVALVPEPDTHENINERETTLANWPWPPTMPRHRIPSTVFALCQIQARRTQHQRFHTMRGRVGVFRRLGDGDGGGGGLGLAWRQAGGALLVSRRRARAADCCPLLFSWRRAREADNGLINELVDRRATHSSSVVSRRRATHPRRSVLSIALQHGLRPNLLAARTVRGSARRPRTANSEADRIRKMRGRSVEQATGDAPETQSVAHCSSAGAAPESAGRSNSEGPRPRTASREADRIRKMRVRSVVLCSFIVSVLFFMFSFSVVHTHYSFL